MNAPRADKILFIDTSGPKLQLALAGDGQAFSLLEDIARGHAEIIFARLATFLSANKTGYNDLTRIGVTTGPGSFTGLRIGISAARGLGLALKIPVIGVPNLLALSLGGPENAHAVILEAKRDQAYVQEFLAPGRPKSAPQLLSLSQAEQFLPSDGFSVLKDPALDIILAAQFARKAKEDDFPPQPDYIRAADAKPQNKMRIARK